VPAAVDALGSVPRDKVCRGAGGTSPASEGAREVWREPVLEFPQLVLPCPEAER